MKDERYYVPKKQKSSISPKESFGHIFSAKGMPLAEDLRTFQLAGNLTTGLVGRNERPRTEKSKRLVGSASWRRETKLHE